jgi:tRNA A37 threonylcarbamoyladenosine modification protein TsaB
MPYSLIVQYPYETIQVAVCKDGNIISSATVHKFNATAETIPTIIELLKAHGLQLSDLLFFGINIGPGPYNTLRAILTMINAIHKVTKITLVTSNGLELLGQEVTEKNSLIILNAFENHIFYQIKTDFGVEQGACSLEELTKIISNQKNQFLIQGNGAIKYEKELKMINNINWPENLLSFNKLETLGSKTFERFQSHDFNEQFLKPIYFEDMAARSYQ